MLAAGIHHLAYFRLEVLVECLHPLVPFGLSFGNVIKLLFHIGCEVVVHDAREVFHQEVVDNDSDICRQQFPLFVACYFLLHSLCHLDSLQ